MLAVAHGHADHPRRTRQLQEQAAGGYASQEIANPLSVSIRTVDNHLGSVYRKLGLDGRSELASIFKV